MNKYKMCTYVVPLSDQIFADAELEKLGHGKNNFNVRIALEGILMQVFYGCTLLLTDLQKSRVDKALARFRLLKTSDKHVKDFVKEDKMVIRRKQRRAQG